VRRTIFTSRIKFISTRIRTAHATYLKEGELRITISSGIKFTRSRLMIMRTATRNHSARGPNEKTMLSRITASKKTILLRVTAGEKTILLSIIITNEKIILLTVTANEKIMLLRVTAGEKIILLLTIRADEKITSLPRIKINKKIRLNIRKYITCCQRLKRI